MSRPKRINLNDYEKVSSREEIRNGGLILQPQGNFPELYWKRKQIGPVLISDTNDVEWNEEIRIETRGTKDQYQDRVSWWISESKQNMEWVNKIESQFKHHSFDPWKSIGKGCGWLWSRLPTQRKSYLKKFFMNKLMSDYNSYCEGRGV